MQSGIGMGGPTWSKKYVFGAVKFVWSWDKLFEVRSRVNLMVVKRAQNKI